MAQLPRRDLNDEVAKHFHGTPEQRILESIRLGRQALDIFLATLPPGTTLAQARALAQRNKHRGRRPSPVMDAPRG